VASKQVDMSYYVNNVKAEQRIIFEDSPYEKTYLDLLWTIMPDNGSELSNQTLET